MNNYKNIECFFVSNDANDIEVKDKSLTIDIVLAVLGAVLIVVSLMPFITNKYVSMILTVTGIVLSVFGLLKLWVDSSRQKHVFIHIPSGEVLKRYSIFVDRHDMQVVQNCISSENYAALSNVKKQPTSGHYVDVMGTPKGNYFAIQMLDYVPHQYVPVSDVVVLTSQGAEVMCGLIKK